MQPIQLGLTLGSITALNMLCWFVLQGSVFAYAGPGAQTDAFFASVTLPQMLSMVVNTTLGHVLVPFFAAQERRQVGPTASALLLLVGGFFAVVCSLLYLMSSWWVPLLVVGFAPATTALTVSLVRIQLVGMVFSVLGAVLFSACHAQGRFVRAEAAPLAATALGVLAMPLVLPPYGMHGAAWVVALRSMLTIVLLLPAAAWTVRPAFGCARSVWRQARPLLLAAGYNKSGQLVDRFLTSMAPPGQLSVFYFADQCLLAGSAIVGKAIAAPMLPTLARLARDGAWVPFQALYRHRLLTIAAVALAGWGVALLLAQPVLAALGPHRGVDASTSALFTQLLLLLGGVLVGGMPGLVLAEAFFAKGDTRTPSLVFAGFFTVGMVLKASGFALGGIHGLALATTLYYLSYPAALFVILERDMAVRRTAPGPAGPVAALHAQRPR